MNLTEFQKLSPQAQQIVFNELLIKSIELVRKENKASISLLQRKLKIGFALANQLIDKLVKLGIVTTATLTSPAMVYLKSFQNNHTKPQK